MVVAWRRGAAAAIIGMWSGGLMRFKQSLYHLSVSVKRSVALDKQAFLHPTTFMKEIYLM
jgi:hypothetical protein